MRLPRKPPGPEHRLGIALLALLAACRASGGPAPAAPPPGPLVAADAARQPAFRALAAALRAGDDEHARRVIAGLRRAALTPEESALLDSAERVLTGRELVRGLALALVSEPVEGQEGRFLLVLRARTSHARELCLRLPPADLKRLRASVNALGVEGLEFESRATPALAELRLLPGEERRVALGDYELPLGRALGVRERWRLEARSGEIECEGVRYPATALRVQACERERLSPLLDADPVPAEALARRLAAGELPATRELLELALRTPPEAREAALAELAPVVEELARRAPERVVRAEPALRWLTQNRDLGPDAAAWARYLAARSASRAPQGAAPADGLDLPERPRAAGRGAGGTR